MSDLQARARASLNVTQEANHRIFVGVGWDPNDNASLLQEITHAVKGKPLHHDLDLSCLIFDEQKNLLESVTADPAQAANQSGKIYHSGDNTEGIGDGDDEQISVELKDLDSDIHHIVFMATIKSGHSFSDVTSPEIHLSDGYSNRRFLYIDLQKAPDNDKPAFLFVHIYKANGEWQLHNISTFVDLQENWSNYIAPYLTEK